MQVKKAIEIKILNGWRGDARLYKCVPPMKNYDGTEREYVIVSAVDVPFAGAETYIFPSNKDGEAINYSEMHGSLRGAMDHNAALDGAGYEIIRSGSFKIN